jgi:hypothetical protein
MKCLRSRLSFYIPDVKCFCRIMPKRKKWTIWGHLWVTDMSRWNRRCCNRFIDPKLDGRVWISRVSHVIKFLINCACRVGVSPERRQVAWTWRDGSLPWYYWVVLLGFSNHEICMRRTYIQCTLYTRYDNIIFCNYFGTQIVGLHECSSMTDPRHNSLNRWTEN